MDVQKKEETTTTDTVTTDVVESKEVETVAESELVTESEAVTESKVETEMVSETALSVAEDPTKFNYKAYLGAVLGILVISAGLVFVLEKEGRISTGLFSTIIEKMENEKKVAVINDVVITQGEYKSSLDQLMQMAGAQGANIQDAEVMANLKEQAIDTLVNGELLRQAAVVAGKTADEEKINTRYAEIEAGIGGAEKLTARMVEFGVSTESLRADIASEILIKALFDEKKIGIDFATATDEEVLALYEKAGGKKAGLPPIEEVKEQIVNQIKIEKEQAQVNELLESLKSEADIETFIE